MRKSIILIIISIIFCGIANAQKDRYSGVNYNSIKGEKFTVTYHKLQLGVLFPSTSPARKNLWYTKKKSDSENGILNLPSLNLQYAWSPNINTEFLIHGAFESVNYTRSESEIKSHSRDFYTLCIGVNYKWYNRKQFTVYSGLLIGGGYSRYFLGKNDSPDPTANIDKGNLIYPSAQLTAIGITLGRKVGGFAELAFGSKGVINAGFYCKL